MTAAMILSESGHSLVDAVVALAVGLEVQHPLYDVLPCAVGYKGIVDLA
jgi:hypothetical protein